MRLHVFDSPGNTTADGVNVWVTEVPDDFTDADVRYNVELLAQAGDATAKRALELVRHWIDMQHPRDSRSRVYLDE